MKYVLTIGFLLTLCIPAKAQVGFDVAGVGTQCNSCTSITFSLTVGSGSNRQLAVGPSAVCATAVGNIVPLVTGVTYNGVALTQGVHWAPTGNTVRYTDIWTMPAGTQPDTGAHNVVVTWAANPTTTCVTTAAAARLNAGAAAFTGVDQSSPFTNSPTGNDGSGTSATMTGLTSGANDMGVNFICSGTVPTSTTETSLFTKINNSGSSCSSFWGARAAGGDTSWSYTLPSDSWVLAGLVWKAASATTCTPGLTLLGVGWC